MEGKNEVRERMQRHQITISAVQLSRLSGVSEHAIHYWAREGFIERSGVPNSKAPFPVDVLEKVMLMYKLIEKYGLDAAKASTLADDLLEMHDEEPDAYEAALALLGLFEENLKKLAAVLAGMGFLDALKAADLIPDDDLTLGKATQAATSKRVREHT